MAQAKAKVTTSTKTSDKQSSNTASIKVNTEKVTETVNEVTMAGLGAVGKVIDQVQDRIENARKEAPKKWDDFVKRGEKLKDNANERVNDIGFSYKFDMEEQRAQFKDVVEAIKAFITPSKV